MLVCTSLNFDNGDGIDESFSILPGVLRKGGRHDDRGGSNSLPAVRAGVAKSGEVEALIDATTGLTLATAISLRSPIGEGTFTITDETNDVVISQKALVDVQITGDAVQTAKIIWKGTLVAST